MGVRWTTFSIQLATNQIFYNWLILLHLTSIQYTCVISETPIIITFHNFPLIMPGPFHPISWGEVDQSWGELVLGVANEQTGPLNFLMSHFEEKGPIA